MESRRRKQNASEEPWTLSDYLFMADTKAGALQIGQMLWSLKDLVEKMWNWCRGTTMSFVEKSFGTRAEPGPRWDIRRRQIAVRIPTGSAQGVR